MYIQAVSGYLAPPIAAIYLLAVLWPRANETVSGRVASIQRRHVLIARLVAGCVLGAAVGLADRKRAPGRGLRVAGTALPRNGRAAGGRALVAALHVLRHV